MLLLSVSRFFGQPPGSSPKPQQAKLAFQKPHTTKATKTEQAEVNGAVKREDGVEADAMEDETADEDVKMDSDLEMHNSARNTKTADSATNGLGGAGSTLGEGEGSMRGLVKSHS